MESLFLRPQITVLKIKTIEMLHHHICFIILVEKLLIMLAVFYMV